MANSRYTALLPVVPEAKLEAAKRAILNLEAAFPEGGTVFAVGNLIPTAKGWWYNKDTGVVNWDSHVIVEIDGTSNNSANDDNMLLLSTIIEAAYSGCPEERYYLAATPANIELHCPRPLRKQSTETAASIPGQHEPR